MLPPVDLIPKFLPVIGPLDDVVVVEGIAVARCTVERVMPELGLTGAVRGKVKRTTIADPEEQGAEDLVGGSSHRLRQTSCG